MTVFKKEIKDEEEGEAHYEELARRHPRYRKMFKKMSEDEEQHESKLEKISRTKALKKKTK